jgi:uracil-DNA glycosylase
MQIPTIWQGKLATEFEKDYFKKLVTFLNQETETTYPQEDLIFNAFEKCNFDDLKVVIIGQDPYHGAGQANGLCFSVNDGIKVPPSLNNIFKEIHNDLGIEKPKTGNLESWAKQGVLLLNSILTVRASAAASHRNQGWEIFTDAVIQLISEHKQQVVFLLWGKYAQQKAKKLDSTKHCILTAAHPSPLSARYFFGNKHFSKTNQYLQQVGKQTIDWSCI